MTRLAASGRRQTISRIGTSNIMGSKLSLVTFYVCQGWHTPSHGGTDVVPEANQGHNFVLHNPLTCFQVPRRMKKGIGERRAISPNTAQATSGRPASRAAITARSA